jgi:putative PIN family toxin of toxin-antitoxin system
MIRLVLDTNMLVSAVGWRHSKQRKILEACLFKRYLLIESAELLEEFVTVISRPKFSFVSEEQKNEFVTRLISHCEIVKPKKTDLYRKDGKELCMISSFIKRRHILTDGDMGIYHRMARPS